MSDDDFYGKVRVTSLQVMKLPDDVYDRWKVATQQCQQIANYIWQRWLVWHFASKSRDKIVAYLDALAAWRESPQGDKPKLDVYAVPNEFPTLIDAELKAAFPTIHDRSRSLIRQVIVGKIKERKAAKGNLSGWMAILLGNESLPNTLKENPIPFDTRMGSIIPPKDKGGHWQIALRITRIPTDKKNSPSITDTMGLWSHGRKAASQVAILRKIATGEWKFCGSQLVLSKSGKFFANICYRMSRSDMVAVELDHTKTAILTASKAWPWNLRSVRRGRPGGRGFHVGNVRQRLLTQRWSRQANYRQAGSSRKGHGRQHAQEIVTKLASRWRDFVKTYNHQVTAEVIRHCVENRIGNIVYYQPSGRFAESRFLATSGKVEGRRDSSSWGWHQVLAMLQYKAQEVGINVTVRKAGESRKLANQPGKSATKRVAKKERKHDDTK